MLAGKPHLVLRMPAAGPRLGHGTFLISCSFGGIVILLTRPLLVYIYRIGKVGLNPLHLPCK